jgi:hypothetical protein
MIPPSTVFLTRGDRWNATRKLGKDVAENSLEGDMTTKPEMAIGPVPDYSRLDLPISCTASFIMS